MRKIANNKKKGHRPTAANHCTGNNNSNMLRMTSKF